MGGSSFPSSSHIFPIDRLKTNILHTVDEVSTYHLVSGGIFLHSAALALSGNWPVLGFEQRKQGLSCWMSSMGGCDFQEPNPDLRPSATDIQYVGFPVREGQLLKGGKQGTLYGMKMGMGNLHPHLYASDNPLPVR